MQNKTMEKGNAMELKAVPQNSPGAVPAQNRQGGAAPAPHVEPMTPAETTMPADTPKIFAQLKTAQDWRRFWTKLSFIPGVLIPALLGIIYFTFVAADRYAVETKFSIRLVSGTPSNDLLGTLTGYSTAGSTVTDSYILIDFIESRELIDQLEQRIDLRSIYSRDEADFLMSFDPEETVEEFKDYLESMISVYYDSSSQIITMEVQAFTPEDARLVSQEIINLSEQLVNELSETARNDTLKFAQEEVARIEDNLRQNRTNMRKFRDTEQDIDPAKTAESQITLLSEVEAKLSQARAQMTNLKRFMTDDAPSVKVLQSKIQSLEEQAATERARLGVKSSDDPSSEETLSARLEGFEELALEQEFSQKAYVSALASLEHARAEANRQQRYLAAFVRPSTPQDALYPERFLNICITIFAAFLIWGISVMTVYIVREHAK